MQGKGRFVLFQKCYSERLLEMEVRLFDTNFQEDYILVEPKLGYL